jgi:predicted RNA-binding Zn-ribbon protein involved in translation (DUF1610 family)
MFRKNDVHTCPSCNTAHRVRGSASYLVLCPACGQVIARTKNYESVPQSVMPDDWSVVQLGSTGVYKEKPFEVIGRVRLQFRQDYKNFWCIWYDTLDKYGWLAESFGEYIVFEDTFFDMDDSKEPFSRFKAGDQFTLHNNTTVTTDYVDLCEWVSLEGELCKWPHNRKGFLSVQAQNNNGIAAYFNILPNNQKGNFLVGQLVKFSELNLKLIREWDEWK